MTVNQLATAAGTDLKWLRNASVLLGRRLKPTTHEARLWALVRLIVSALDVSLKLALEIANDALDMERVGVTRILKNSESRVVSIVLDLDRFESIFNGNLSRALELEYPRRRGRPREVHGTALERARRYGIDVSLLESGLNIPVATRLERLDANSEFLRAIKRVR